LFDGDWNVTTTVPAPGTVVWVPTTPP
jgi:hypothetical protein